MKKILIVDDEVNMLLVLEAMLRKEVYAVKTASDGTEALEILQADDIAVVVTDLKMPRTDGMELLRLARKEAPHAAVIMVSGVGSVETAVEALKEGASDFLAKPVNTKELKRKPFILRRTPSGLQSVEIFDTKDQARIALKAYRNEQQLQAMQNQKVEKIPTDQQMETARLAAEHQAREYAARLMADRVRIEQVEARRLQDLIAKFAMLSPEEKAKRREEAQKLAAEGLELFKESKFAEAKVKYDKDLKKNGGVESVEISR